MTVSCLHVFWWHQIPEPYKQLEVTYQLYKMVLYLWELKTITINVNNNGTHHNKYNIYFIFNNYKLIGSYILRI
jgi:hypothetical protein